MATKRIKIEIEKSTKKAHLVKDLAGRIGWIQRRWLADDSTVSVKTFEKAVANYKERAEIRQEAKEWANACHRIVEVARETTKAIAVKASFDAYDIERTVHRLVWIPKSLIQNGGVPGWWVAKKIDELKHEFYEHYQTGIMLNYVKVENCDRLL